MRRVLKYGGTSIETADRVRRAAKNVARLVHEGDQVSVVVSAQGNDTNLLLGAVYAATERQVDAQSVYRIAAMGEMRAFEHQGFWQPMDTLREKNLLEDLWVSGKAPWKIWS